MGAVTVSPHSNLHLQREKLTHPPKPNSPLTCTPTTLTYATPCVSLLQKSSTMVELNQIHAQMIKTGHIHDPLSLTKLLSSLSDFGDLEYAFRIFSAAPYKNSIIWNTLIHAHSLSSMPELSIKFFVKMLEEEPFLINSFTFPSILKACARINALSEGTQIHGFVIKLDDFTDAYVQNALIQLYSACGKLCNARRLFDKMSERTVVSWNCIIAGYSKMGCWEDVKFLFWSMVEMFSYSVVPNLITLVRMITACIRSRDFDSGKRVHRYIEESGVGLSLNLGNTLMNMYGKFGEIGVAHCLFDDMCVRDVVSWTTLVSGYAGLGFLVSAREIFDRMPNRNVVAWNAMIAGYVLNSCFKEATLLFKEMLILGVKPDKATIVSILSACARLEDLFIGRVIHGYVDKVGIELTHDLLNSLLGMYCNCGSMDSAELLFNRMVVRNEISWTLMMMGYVRGGEKDVALEIFSRMPHKDLVSWNALISVLAQCNWFNEALGLFQEMQRTKVSPNGLTLVSTLSACARAGALELGKWIHAYIERNNIEMDAHLGSSLVDMYAKCGCIELSLEVFNKMPTKDLLAWSTMIGGLAMHGDGKLALKLFKQMQEDGVQPDRITFLGVLSACRHAGLVDEGCHCFDLMTQVYSISPETEHYSCMVDLLGRHGRLSEAMDFIKNIPMTLNGEAIWGALLGACRIHGNVELAEYATNRLLEMDPSKSGAYVLLSNVYAKALKWDDVGKVRNMMKDRGVQKVPGCSSIAVNGVVCEFFVGESSHPQGKEIHMMLEVLKRQLESEGYFENMSYID